MLKTDHLSKVAATDPDLTIHDPSNWMQAMRLAKLHFPAFPVPIGVYYQKPRAAFQLPHLHQKDEAALACLFNAGAAWTLPS